jgi:hypothetical protein
VLCRWGSNASSVFMPAMKVSSKDGQTRRLVLVLALLKVGESIVHSWRWWTSHAWRTFRTNWKLDIPVCVKYEDGGSPSTMTVGSVLSKNDCLATKKPRSQESFCDLWECSHSAASVPTGGLSHVSDRQSKLFIHFWNLPCFFTRIWTQKLNHPMIADPYCSPF